MSWEISWGEYRIPVTVTELFPEDPSGEMTLHRAEFLANFIPVVIRNPDIPLRGFGFDEDQAILDLYRDIHRRMT